MTQLHEITGENIVKGGSVSRVPYQYFIDEVDSLRRSVDCFWDHIGTLFDSLVGGVGIFCFKGRNTEVQGVKNDSYAPDVNFKVVPSPVKHLRGDVVGCSTNCPLAFSWKFQLGGQSEITYFHI